MCLDEMLNRKFTAITSLKGIGSVAGYRGALFMRISRHPVQSTD